MGNEESRLERDSWGDEGIGFYIQQKIRQQTQEQHLQQQEHINLSATSHQHARTPNAPSESRAPCLPPGRREHPQDEAAINVGPSLAALLREAGANTLLETSGTDDHRVQSMAGATPQGAHLVSYVLPDNVMAPHFISNKRPQDAFKDGRRNKRPQDAFRDERRDRRRQDAINDERRASTSSSTKPGASTGIPSPASQLDGNDNEIERHPPSWYRDMPMPNRRDKTAAASDALLSSLRVSISKAKEAVEPSLRLSVFAETQHKLHVAAFCKVTAQILKTNRMLHNQDGLCRIFDSAYTQGVEWPWHIRADAIELYNKWCRRDFDFDIMRGILFDMSVPNSLSGKRKSDSLDPKYRHKVPCNYHGNGDLVNGQWWPLQLCALRDGAHGVTQGGIHGRDGEGVYSVIMSGDHNYPDEDHGNWVLYCGTDSTDGTISPNTRLLIESAKSQKPVRLLRSSRLGGEYAPVKGFRYDGLYVIVSYERLDAANSTRQRHRFRLNRCDGQDPIRGGTGPDARPTEQELDAYKNHQRLAGKAVRGG